MKASPSIRRIGVRTLFLAMVAVTACTARGGVILPGPEGLAIFAGGQINAQASSSITGSIGAIGSIWLGAGSGLTGDLFTTGSLSTGGSASLTGDLFVTGSTYLGNKATVAGNVLSRGNFGTGSRVTVTGDVATEGRIDLGNKSKIMGQGWYQTGYGLGSQAQVLGGLGVIDGTVDVWSPGNLDDLTLAPAGSDNVTKNNGSVSALDPGAYGSLSVGKNATINLIAGQYSFSSMALNRSAVLNVDTSAGDVVIYVQQSVVTGSSFQVNTTGQGGVSFIVGGGIALGAGSNVDASLVSLSSDITLASSASVTGQLWAQGNVNLGYHAGVGGEAFITIPLAGGATIPEPATIVMVGVGLSLVTHRKICQSQR